MGMRVDIVTLFPEMCQQVLDASIIGRAAAGVRRCDQRGPFEGYATRSGTTP